MFFSSVHRYDTQNRQERSGLSINTVALLSLKIKRRENNVAGGRKKEPGRREADDRATGATLLPACYIRGCQRHWRLVTPGLTSHLSTGPSEGR